MAVVTCQHMQDFPVTPKEGMGWEKALEIGYMENEPESCCLVSITMTLFCILPIYRNMTPTNPQISKKQVKIFSSETVTTMSLWGPV